MKRLYALALILAAADLRAAEPEDDSAIEEITVVATRSRQLVRDQAVRVEVVPQEELEESQTVAPGNLTNLLNELAGARMDLPSAGLGGTSLRLRGMPGRHAQVLSDGLALSGSQTDSFSLLQVPPIDLGRVEVVKGVASALYGGSALAGVLNLVSRPPDGKSQWLLSQSSLGGSDADMFVSRPGFGRGIHVRGQRSLPGTARRGSRRLERDSRLPAPHRATPLVHRRRQRTPVRHVGIHRRASRRRYQRQPRAALGRTLSGRAGHEPRRRGHGRQRHARRRQRRRRQVVRGTHAARARVRDSRHRRLDHQCRGRGTWQAKLGIHEWTLGGALLYDELSVPEVAGIGYRYTVPGVFAQDEFSPASWLSVSASARVDFHDEFGTFVSPRLLGAVSPGSRRLVARLVGHGLLAGHAAGGRNRGHRVGALDPLTGLQAERASSGSLDFKWAVRPFEINLSAFASEIRHPLDAESASQPGRVVIVNDREPLRIRGAELLVGGAIGDTHLLFNSTYLDATEESPGGGRRSRGADAGTVSGDRGHLRARRSWPCRLRNFVHRLAGSPRRSLSRSTPHCSKSTRWRNGISASSRCS
jgi:iron complex outermembrane receptor protein